MAEGLPMYLTVVIIGQIVYGRFFIPAFLHHCLPCLFLDNINQTPATPAFSI